VRFGLGATEYEIDLSKRTPMRSAGRSRPSLSTPTRRGGGSGAGPGGPHPAVSAARTSRPGRRTSASRSAARGRIPTSVAEQYEGASQGS